MKKRVLSALLVLAMMLSLMPGMSLTAAAETYPPNYLTFTAQQDNSMITFSWLYGSNVQVSRDSGITWENYGKDTTISLNTDETVSFKGRDIGTTYTYRFHMTGKIAASGSVTSLTDGNGGNPDVQLDKDCYGSMFRECDALVTAPELPATKLSQSCYTCMFYGCKNLATAPVLPASEAAELCYSYMFANCSSLTEAPALPATVLGSQCYLNMFWYCTKLTNAPALPAETLKDYCYSYMFEGCTGLTKAPELPATTMKEGCYKEMFHGCTSLTAAPDLPATTLAKSCYSGMFKGCSSLKIGTDRTDDPWKIHAQSVPDYAANWDSDMFAGCTNVDFGDNSKTPALNTRYYTGDTRQVLTPVAYIYYTADGNTSVRHDDGSCTEYEIVAEDATIFRNGKWYVVSGDVTFDRRITVNGTANLILCNDATLTALKGIDVSGENALNIFAQSENENTMGKLIAKGEECTAGIGGGNGSTGGTVTIYGGTVQATGGKEAAGIGGTGGTVTIYGGTVDVIGGAASAGIGGDACHDGGNVTINGGTVIAKGGAGGTAIGSGWQGTGGSVTINGGTVTATGATDGAAIGGGNSSQNSTVTINGGTVTATSGRETAIQETGGAAIGGGNGSKNCTVAINGGAVTATTNHDDCVGIGNCTLTLGEDVVFGAGEDAKNITQWGRNDDAPNAVGKKYFVTPYNVFLYAYYTTEGATAIKHDDGCCLAYEIVTDGTTEFENGRWYVVSKDVTVGSRITVSGTANLILCDGATLTASKGISVTKDKILNIYAQDAGEGALIAKTEQDGGAAIGGDYSDGGNIYIHGGIINAAGNNQSAGIGGGSYGNGGTTIIYGGTVNATGGKNSAAIGGGNYGNGGTITIYGGTVTANVGSESVTAGIGGGNYGDGGEITINGGEVNATGGSSGASAIGGNNGTVTINGGTVNATGGNGWSYAIGGSDGSITINGGNVAATGGTSWNCAIGSTSVTLGDGVIFGAGDDDKNITVWGDKDKASEALGQHYFVTPYEHEHVFDQKIAAEQYLKSEATCTEAAVYYKSCICGEVSTTETFTSGEAPGHDIKVVEEVAATCTTDGYIRKACSRCDYVEESSIPASGHSFAGVAYWEWIAGVDGYSVNAVCKCTVCREGKKIVPAAAMISSTDDSYITYVASIEMDGTEYSTMKMDQVAYSLDVTNGRVIGGLREDGQYRYSDLITVQAEEAKEGQFFSGWYLNGEKVSDNRTYKFYLKNDTKLIACYEDTPVEIAPLVSLEATDRIALANGKQQLKLIVRWELPLGYQPVKAGLVRGYSIDDPAVLSLNNVDGSAIKDSSVAAVINTGSFTLNLTLSAASAAKDLSAVGYLECVNAAGEHVIVYTDPLVSAAK